MNAIKSALMLSTLMLLSACSTDFWRQAEIKKPDLELCADSLDARLLLQRRQQAAGDLIKEKRIQCDYSQARAALEQNIKKEPNPIIIIPSR